MVWCGGGGEQVCAPYKLVARKKVIYTRYAWYVKRVPPGPFIQTMTENICHISREKIKSGIQRKRVRMIMQLLTLQALFADVSNPHVVC